MRAEWKITGAGLPALRIEAESFDDAIEEARKIDQRYCGGQIIDRKKRQMPGKR